jgi:hypothetical protein
LMTKIYENDERNKLLPILITINFISRTSWPMFLFVIKRKVANLEFDISIYESYISIIRHWRRLCIVENIPNCRIPLNTLKSVGIRKSLNSMKYSFSNPSTP